MPSKKSSHGVTPGPWHYQEKSDVYTHIVRAADNAYVCGCSHGDAEANARLIAAAPELLYACQTVKSFLGDLEGCDDDPLTEIRKRIHAPLHEALDRAIAKAEGK